MCVWGGGYTLEGESKRAQKIEVTPLPHSMQPYARKRASSASANQFVPAKITNYTVDSLQQIVATYKFIYKFTVH